MCTFSLKTCIVRLAYVLVLSCSSAVAQAQLTSFPEFFERHFRYEATDAQDGPKLSTQFNYSANNTLITRSSVKFNNDGFEDHMAMGIVQNFGAAQAKVTYNLQRYNYTSWQSQSNNVTFDFRYRSLRMQHRLEDTAQVSTIGLPFEVSAAHFDLSYSQTLQQDLATPIDMYSLVSRVNGLSLSASWRESGAETWADLSTEYRPSRCWLMKYTYTDHGADVARQFRSVYTARNYRLAGEFSRQRYAGEQTHSTGAVYIEKASRLAALKLRLEYDGYIDSRTLFFQVEPHIAF